MRVTTIDAHVGGAAVRLVVSGLPTLEGDSLASRQQAFEEQAGRVRRLLCREPRGHAGTTGVILTDPGPSHAAAAMLFFDGEGYPPLCGHALIGAVMLALERGVIVPADPDAFSIDTMAGVVAVRVSRDGAGRVAAVRYVPPPAHVIHAGLPVRLGNRIVRADVAWSGSEALAITDAETAGVPLVPSRVLELQRAGVGVTRTIQDALPPAAAGPPPDLAGTVFIGPATSGEAELRSALVTRDGVVERSPSGAATAAVTAVLHAMGMADVGRRVVHEGLLGTSFTASVVAVSGAGLSAACEIEVEGRAYPTGEHVFTAVPDDPLADGVAVGPQPSA